MLGRAKALFRWHINPIYLSDSILGAVCLSVIFQVIKILMRLFKQRRQYLIYLHIHQILTGHLDIFQYITDAKENESSHLYSYNALYIDCQSSFTVKNRKIRESVIEAHKAT